MSAGRAGVLALVVFVLSGAITHLVLIWRAPLLATDHQISEGIRRGGAWNTLLHGPPPRAGATSVPLANPDTLGSRAYLDLRKGPFQVLGTRPDGCIYWSASVFAHNTDTVLLLTDGDTPDRQVSLGIRTAEQTFSERVRHEAVLPSATGVLLIRCFMRDRTDAAYIAKLDAQRRQIVLRPMEGGAQ